MPQMPDAPVIVSGAVFNVAPIIGRDGDDQGKNLGFTVTLLVQDESGNPGASVVKVKRDKATNLVPIDEPGVMENVAWVVKSSPWAVGGNSGMATQFVRRLSVNDLDKLISYSGLALTSK
jgi:hypothetical protein